MEIRQRNGVVRIVESSALGGIPCFVLESPVCTVELTVVQGKWFAQLIDLSVQALEAVPQSTPQEALAWLGAAICEDITELESRAAYFRQVLSEIGESA